MTLFNADSRRTAELISRLAYCNPFLPERIELEREILGADFVETSPVWSKRFEMDDSPNVLRIGERAEVIAQELRDRLLNGAKLNQRDVTLYEDLVLYVLFHRWRVALHETIERSMNGDGRGGKIGFWQEFLAVVDHFLNVRGHKPPSQQETAHLFACFFQLRRAFHHIFENILGGSMPAARLRAAVWQSIFTHDMRRYRQSLYARMGDFTTLISGPSGTGKELVARAVGLSRYLPFDPAKATFAGDMAGSFHALNLSALSPTLIESELFGHRRGAFTGALDDRVGWLEVCEPLGTVFLDEIGELDATVQVKLLRVVQSRAFQRLGETKDRRFQGKIIAATNRNLAEEMRAGRFREDFYYRLCSDIVTTPSLREQIADSPDELHALIRFLVERIGGEGLDTLADEVHAWIEQNLGRDYAWPGNIRELEQCVRNVIIRGQYHPPQSAATSDDPYLRLAEGMRNGSLTFEDILSRYCTLVYAQTGNYQETARRLKLDRRTVKARIDQDLLERLRRSTSATATPERNPS